ncbi:hypothetical protein SLS58_004085 [Diplodia intermedia]|uniref:Chitin-binding type-2 domain-containing protein n=1 Tax=Diplodia intermedia TaxID=856260 RepID=A0ABR3TV71_9PEZI
MEDDKKRAACQDESRCSMMAKEINTSTGTRANDYTSCSLTTCSWRDRRKTQLRWLSRRQRQKLWCSSCSAAHPKSSFSHAERHLPEQLRQCTGSLAHIRLCTHRRLTHSELQRACDERSGSQLLCSEGCVGVERYPAERTRGYPCPSPPHGTTGKCIKSTQLFRQHVRLDVDDRTRLGVDDHDLLAAVFAADARLCPHLRVADCLNDFRFAGAPTAHFHPKGQDACSDACSEFFWCPRSYDGCNTSLYLYSQRVSCSRGGDDEVGSAVEPRATAFDEIHLLSFRNLGAMDDPNDTAWLMQLDDGWRAAKFWSRVRRRVGRLVRC